MKEDDAPFDDTQRRSSRLRGMWPKRWRWRISLFLLGIIIALFAVAWFSREQIATDLIDQTLDEMGLEAHYEIESIGVEQQVIRNLVIGDPANPNMTAERVVVSIAYRLGTPGIGRVEVEGARLYGSYREGKLSFGALDPVVFTQSDTPPGLPDLTIALHDARARMDTDFGNLGAHLEGEGNLYSGFAGVLAVTAPQLGVEGCTASNVTLYGDLTTDGGEPRFSGPVRTGGVACQGAELENADVQAELELASDFAKLSGSLTIATGTLTYASATMQSVQGDARLSWDFGNGDVSLAHDLTADTLDAGGVAVEAITAKGTMRSGDNLASFNWNADVSGEGVAVPFLETSALADARENARGTLAEALIAKLERGLSRNLPGSSLTANVTVRSDGGRITALIPEARLNSSAGDALLTLRQASYVTGGDAPTRMTGNLATGGADLPRITGRIEQVGRGDMVARLALAPYGAGQESLSIPRLTVRLASGGMLLFDGVLRANGALPGGAIRGAEIPVQGRWSAGGGLIVGERCTPVRFSALQLYNLDLSGNRLNLCPAQGRALLSYQDTLNIGVQTNALALDGKLSGTPLKLRSDAAVLRYPGSFSLENIAAQIGEDGNGVTLNAASLQGDFADRIGGTFSDGFAAIDAVPLDLSGVEGAWDYTDSVLSISDGAFILTERLPEGEVVGETTDAQARFEPLFAQGAVLTLANNRISAKADLLNLQSGALVTSVTLQHDLDQSAGWADLDVPGLTFELDGLQPSDLTYLTEGVADLADGTITGDGHIEWTAQEIQSKGTFRTDAFNFAAAFGPVKGVAGEITFTDLLGMTTAPSQVLTVASVNPGVEAKDGRVVFAITDGEVLTLEQGRWPFMGGELMMRPNTVSFGEGSGQRYIFEMTGIDAAVFVTEVEMSNISATGTFDGTVPIYFDENGNGAIEGGLLIARPPGGNISYVGDLSYEDLGAMGNFAFQALRSLDFKQMSIGLNGDLDGEIITNFQIDGVQQGEGASQNFVTRRLAKLPIRFRINVRSDSFFALAKIVRGLFDPTQLGDPIDQGLIRIENGKMVTGTGEPSPPAPTPSPAPEPTPAPNPDSSPNRRNETEPAVQPSESDNLP